MTSLDSLSGSDSHLNEELSQGLEAKKAGVLSGIAEFLQSGTIEDEKERGILTDAASFVENPTKNLQEITRHSTHVGHVAGGYDMEGADVPPAIDAMNAYLFGLICVNRIRFVEEEIAKGNGATPEVRLAIKIADDRATHLSRGYKDGTMLAAVNTLQERLNNL